MADNYLENKMEEHRRGTSAAPRRLSPTGQRPGMLTVKFPRRNVLVIDNTAYLSATAIKTLASAGCQVSFCGTERRAGTMLAQSSASRFYPVESFNESHLRHVVTDIIKLKGSVDAVITPAAAAETAFPLLIGSLSRQDGGYNGRFIITGDPEEAIYKRISDEAEAFEVTVIAISSGSNEADVSSLLPALLLEGGRLLHGHTI